MKMTINRMRAHVDKAARRGDLATAERWTRLTERHFRMLESELKLAALDLANEAKQIENMREARLEERLRTNRY